MTRSAQQRGGDRGAALRVLLVEGSGRGFLSHYTHALALGLHESGAAVRLVTGARDELRDWCLPIEKRPCLAGGARGWFALRREVLEFRPQVVHLQWVASAAAALLFVLWLHKRGIHAVYTPHNILPHRRRWLALPAFHALYRRMDRIIARDPHVAWGLEELLGVARRKVVLLPGSPNLMAHPLAPGGVPHEVPEKRAGEVRLLFFGHGCGRKGLADFLGVVGGRAWPAALHVVIAGEGVLAGIDPALLRAAAVRVRVTLTDRYVEPSGVAALFGAADLLVMPYVKLCRSPLLDLAASFGLPVLRSDRVQGAWFREGVCGVTVPHGDPAALGAALARLVARPALLARMRAALAREENVVNAIRRLSAGHHRLYLDLCGTAGAAGAEGFPAGTLAQPVGPHEGV